MSAVHHRRTNDDDDDDAAALVDAELEDRLSALLASPSFSVARYLNLALRGSEADDDGDAQHNQRLERRMASLALQLQMHTQSCHDEIGRIGAELTAVVPRCATDVERIHVGLNGIESDVLALLAGMEDDDVIMNEEGRAKEEEGMMLMETNGADVGGGVGISSIASVDKNHSGNSINANLNNNLNNNNNNNNKATTTTDDATIHPLATLHTLLNLRTHLTSARSILSAAASWDETINSIPMLLSTSPPNLIEAVAALSQLEDGARALAGMPEGKDDRDAAMVKLRSRLEALLKPRLLHALKKMDTRLGPLVQCVTMYDSLGKMDVIREEYVKIRPVEVHSLWFSFVGGAAACGGGGKKEDNNDDKKGRKTALASTGDGEEEVVEDFDFGDDVDDDGGIVSTATVSTTIMTTTTTAHQFVDFLPKFYDATLELLTKERAQCKQIFGTELAPGIVVRVLMECFRPIVTSFAKRLGMLCPLPEQQRKGVIVEGGANSGGMEAIASVYESTVRFMSLAYDTMEAWNVGSSTMTNDTKKIGEEKEKVRRAIRSAYLLIASPFLPYQRALVESEQRPMSEAASMIAREVRGVTNFEDAAERLGDLAPYMFPLAEAIMNRYELLNCGYNASTTLAAIDKIVANHAVELSITMGTLSTNALSSTGHEFEEQHVNCALEILRIAGLFKRNLLSFEHTVKDRFRALSVVMVDPGLDDVDFVPDELSPIQIRAMLAREACDPSPTYVDDGTGAKCPTSVLQLRRLAGGGGSMTNNENSTVVLPLFPRSHDSTSRLARACLSLVFEVCSAIPERQLRGISALPIWKQDRGGGDVDEEESYGILPQQYITQVGEHLLALVQALEPFASNSEALELVNEVMNNVMEVAVQPWKEFVAATGCSFTGDGKSQVEMLMMGRDMSKFLLDDAIDDECGLTESKKNEDEIDDGESALFCNKWLDVIGLAVTGRLLERMMRIPRLGRRGAERLATDLNYIMNVFTALGVPSHPHPLLKYITQLVMMDDQMLRSKIQLHRGETSEVVEVVKRAELRIAHVRGISV